MNGDPGSPTPRTTQRVPACPRGPRVWRPALLSCVVVSRRIMDDYSHRAPPGRLGWRGRSRRLALTFDSAQGGLRGTRRWLQYGLYIRNVLHTDEWKDRVNRRKHGESRTNWRRGDKAGGPLADSAVRLSFAIRWVCAQFPIPGWMGDLPSIPGPQNARDPSASSGQARGHPRRGLDFSPGPGSPATRTSFSPSCESGALSRSDLAEYF